MSHKGHSGQKNKLYPLPNLQMAGPKGLNKIRKFRNKSLKTKAYDKSRQHQAIVQMLHPKQGGFHIPHADGVEELGDPKHRKSIGLGTGENLRCRQENPQVLKA